MATITFTKQLSTDDLLNAYNNNVIEFSSDSTLESDFAVLGNLAGNTLRISPSPDGVFRYNFKEIFKTILNKNNFADDSVPSISGVDITTLIDEDTANSYKTIGLSLQVFYVGGSSTRVIFNYKVLKSVENIKNYKARIMDAGTRDLFLLSPFIDVADRKCKLTYWEGYPFDVSYYHNTTKDRKITLGDDDITVSFKAQVGRFVIDDGNTNIDVHLPIFDGLNSLLISPVVPLAAEDWILELTKISGACGKYIKWTNQYGKWNYWLFNQKDRTLLTTKPRKPIDNDFDDLDDNQSPSLGTGRDSDEVLVCHSRGVSEDEMLVLAGLTESPKIYLYTAESGTQYAVANFIEVELLGDTTMTDDYHKKTFNVNYRFKLPPRNTLTL